MRRVRAGLVVVGFLLACGILARIALAVGPKAIVVYVGALLAAWLFAAFAVPLLFGVITPGELLASLAWRRAQASHHEGDPLPARRPRLFVRAKTDELADLGTEARVAGGVPFAVRQD